MSDHDGNRSCEDTNHIHNPGYKQSFEEFPFNEVKINQVVSNLP